MNQSSPESLKKSYLCTQVSMGQKSDKLWDIRTACNLTKLLEQLSKH